jgi:hypothetical protein
MSVSESTAAIILHDPADTNEPPVSDEKKPSYIFASRSPVCKLSFYHTESQALRAQFRP